MLDINSYANRLLLEFLDAAHDRVKSVLRAEFGEEWLAKGVERHLNKSAIERTRKMLSSPMKVVDLDRTDDELYGVEHLGSIIIGNWQLFGESFENRQRTEVYFGEIAELRHNVSHRRQRHMLGRRELSRFVQNAQMLLAALGSPTEASFESISVSLEQGGSPWGRQLSASLPPATEIVSSFIGREAEIRQLSTWLTSNDSHRCVIWGYGGSGKSALAYQFARAVRDGAPENLQAVLWLSAKVREYVGGDTRDRIADFDSVDSFVAAFWRALYGQLSEVPELGRESMVRELAETPLLLVVDDVDSVLDQEELAHFLLYEIQTDSSKVIYTTRQKLHGLQTVEVAGFSEQELSRFVRSRAREYELDTDECLGRLEAIRSVTDGFPLFVDDLMRYAMFDGVKRSLEDWSQRRGDAAREYALRRQLSSLGDPALRALIAVAVAGLPVSSLELSSISGFPDDDVQDAIQSLRDWRLISRYEMNESGHPTFSCNRNTQRLVQKTYGRDPKYVSCQESLRTLTGSPLPAGLRRAVGVAIGDSLALARRGDQEGALSSLQSAMTGELANNSDLWGVYGRLLSRDQGRESSVKARAAFRRAHSRGSRNEETYYYWIDLESAIANALIDDANDADLLCQWRTAADVADMGIDRCGETQALCNFLAYLKGREARDTSAAKAIYTSRGSLSRERTLGSQGP